VLPAISFIDGIIHCKIVEGSFCTETFQQFIEGLLKFMEPYPGPNSVIVMDNCQIHKHPDIVEMIESRFAITYNSNTVDETYRYQGNALRIPASIFT
jgi:DDE superfamily endonuclease